MELQEYLAPIRKWWWLLLVTTAVATLASVYATQQQPPIYEARAAVLVGSTIDDPNPNNSDVALSQQLARTYTEIAGRGPVREAAKEALGLSWLPEYRVAIVPTTQLIEIRVVDTVPVRAQAVANEIANQLVLQSPEGRDEQAQERQLFVNQQLDELQLRIEESEAELAGKQAELASAIGARQLADLQSAIAALQSKLNTLQLNYATLLSNTDGGALNSIHIVEQAWLPINPIGPNKPLTIALSGLIGLLLAAGACYLLEYLDDTLKNPKEVEKALALTTLGAVPASEEFQAQTLAVTQGGQSPAIEAYRVLRTNLQFASLDRPLRLILVTSASPSEGKSTTAANLAASMALSGRSVILVDGDLHRPRQHKIFGRKNDVGVTSSLLAERMNPEAHLQPTGVEGLRLLPSGPQPPNPAELLSSERMQHLLESLKGLADVVILDSPPATALSDAAILSTHSDGVLFVIDALKTRREMARRATAGLQQVKARLLGVVLNRMPMRQSDSYYYYYYNHNYDYYNTPDSPNGKGPSSRPTGKKQPKSAPALVAKARTARMPRARSKRSGET